MRLIDADALKKRLQEQQKYGHAQDSRGRAKAIAEVIQAPTIDAEPVRHGYWVIRGGDMWCSECGYGDVTEFGEPEDYHYCPHCGAKMDGD